MDPLHEREWHVQKFEFGGPVSLEGTLNKLEDDGWTTMHIIPRPDKTSLDIVPYRNVPHSYGA